MAAAVRRILFAEPFGPLGSQLLSQFKANGHKVFAASCGKDLSALEGVDGKGVVEKADRTEMQKVLEEAKKHFDGKSPDVLIVSLGCGKRGLLHESPSVSDAVDLDDVQTLQRNVKASHEWLHTCIPEMYEEVEEGTDVEEPKHIILLGSYGGIPRSSFAGTMYKASSGRLLENIRRAIKNSNISLTLVDVGSDAISLTGRVVQWNSKVKDINDTEQLTPEVAEAVHAILDSGDISDVAKVVWPNDAVKSLPWMESRIKKMKKKGEWVDLSKLKVEKRRAAPAASAAEAVVEEEAAPVVEAKTHVNVMLTSVEDLEKNKLKVIKAMKALFPKLTLMQCKEMIGKLPVKLDSEVPRADAEKIQAELKEVGGVVDLE